VNRRGKREGCDEGVLQLQVDPTASPAKFKRGGEWEEKWGGKNADRKITHGCQKGT